MNDMSDRAEEASAPSEQSTHSAPKAESQSGFTHQVVVVLALAALAFVLLYAGTLLTAVWMVLFASILLAVFLDGLARLVRRWLPVGPMPSVLIVVLVLTGLAVGLGFLLGPRVADQLVQMRDRIPQAIEDLRVTIGEKENLAKLMPSSDWARRGLLPDSGIGQELTNMFSSVFGFFTALFAVAVIGFYSALQPAAYTGAALALVPPERRENAAQLLRVLGHALRQWLLGRFLSMLAVGVLTSVALWALDVPMALGLGLIAGALSFVPFIGPLVSAVPAVLIGFLNGPEQVLWILIIYAGVQVVEGNVITPVVQSYVISIPPAGILTAQLVFGALFGFIGILVATPLAVVLIVLVQVVYVRWWLGQPVRLLAGVDMEQVESVENRPPRDG